MPIRSIKNGANSKWNQLTEIVEELSFSRAKVRDPAFSPRAARGCSPCLSGGLGTKRSPQSCGADIPTQERFKLEVEGLDFGIPSSLSNGVWGGWSHDVD